MKKLFVIFIMSIMLLPIQVYSEQEAISAESETAQVETIEEDNKTDSVNANQAIIDENKNSQVETNNSIDLKKPISKKKLLKKFFVAMICVIGTSLFLYIILSIYNRIRYSISNQQSYYDGERPLDVPNDITEAVKSFVDKTHWEN